MIKRRREIQFFYTLFHCQMIFLQQLKKLITSQKFQIEREILTKKITSIA